MNYLLSITNLILMQTLLYFSFVKNKKNIKTNIIYLSISLLSLVVLCIFLNHALIFPIAGLQWNILFPLILSLQILGILFVSSNKTHTLISVLLPSIIDLFSKTILCIFLDIPFNEMNRPGYFYFSTHLFIMQVFIETFIFILYKLFKELHTYDDNKYSIFIITGLITLELFSFILINLNISSIIIMNQTTYIRIILLNVLLVTLIFITIILFYLLQKSIKKKYQEINQYKEELLDKNYQDIYIESQEELFKLRHDMANMIESINTYNQNDLKDLKQGLSQKLNEQKFFYTKNKVINSVLVNKLKLAKQKNISVEIDITIDRELTLSNIDSISLFSNLLDNAIDALENEENKQLILTVGTTNETLEILLKNSCHILKKTKKENPKYHGYGLKIIKEIVHKYKGEYSSFIENNMYTTMIIIKC